MNEFDEAVLVELTGPFFKGGARPSSGCTQLLLLLSEFVIHSQANKAPIPLL